MSRVDIHHHWLPEEHVNNPEEHLRTGERIVEIDLEDGQTAKRIMREGIPLITMAESRSYVDRRVDHMDEAGVDKAVLTAATWTNWLDNLSICRFYNDKLHERVVSEYPDRFIGAAHVPIGTDSAVRELERCVEDLGFEAVGIAVHSHGHLPDEEIYYPVYEKAQELDVPILVHVANAPTVDNGMHEYDMGRTAGRVFDHHVVVGRLLRSDVFERFPDLQFVHGHLGGSFPMNKFRYGQNQTRSTATDEDKQLVSLTPDELETRMENNYFATTFYDQLGLEYSARALGPDRLIYGTDYPINISYMKDTVDAIEELDVSEREKEGIFERNVEDVIDL